MFLGRYDFAGDSAELRHRYDALMAQTPTQDVQFHCCVVHDGGITIYDACPSVEVFQRFSTSPEFLAQVRDAGLPEPVVTPIGEVHVARTGATFIG